MLNGDYRVDTIVGNSVKLGTIENLNNRTNGNDSIA